jgi:NADPH-dependent F420 reductase
MEAKVTKIAVIGGTGKEGKALALRWAVAGQQVLIGSRTPAKAQAVAQEMNEKAGAERVSGLGNRDAAAAAEVVVLSLPYSGQLAILEQIKDAVRGKVLVNVSVPLDPESPRRIKVPPAGSATAEVQEFLGADAKVVAAFQNVSAHIIADPQAPVECDILVCGDDKGAKKEAMRLVELAGMQPFDAGALANAVAVEGLTAILINVNIRYKSKGAGIRLTNIPR